MSAAIETQNINPKMDLLDDHVGVDSGCGNLNDSLRRLSVDSGVSMSPSPMTPSSNDPSQQRRKKKKRIRSNR